MLDKLRSGASSTLSLIAIVVFTLLVLDVLWGVASRYLLGLQARWSEELARLLMVWLALLGTVLAYLQQKHLGVDILMRQLHPDAQRVAQVFVHFVVLLFAGVVLCYGGGQLVQQRWTSGQALPALGISKAWFYLAIPICGLLISLFSIESMIDAARGRFVIHPEDEPGEATV
jgi:TRAP-type C4-dicarboxylate transport system permease small subunit